MKKIPALASVLLLSATLSGCAVEPYPYMGGGAPYYGTTYTPAYAYNEVAVGGYYRSYNTQHIHSGYNNNYWHHQYTQQHGGGAPAHFAAPQAHGGGAPAHGGGGHGGDGHDGGHH